MSQNPDYFRRKAQRQQARRSARRHSDPVYAAECRQKDRDKAARRRAADPEGVRATERAKGLRRRLRAYGLAPEDYRTLVEEHAGFCGLCCRNRPQRPLKIDRDKITGIIRGLVCGSCGFFLSIHMQRGQITLKQLAEYYHRTTAK